MDCSLKFNIIYNSLLYIPHSNRFGRQITVLTLIYHFIEHFLIDPTMGEACSMDSDCNQHHSECSGVCSCVDGYEYDQFALECYPGE